MGFALLVVAFLLLGPGELLTDQADLDSCKKLDKAATEAEEVLDDESAEILREMVDEYCNGDKTKLRPKRQNRKGAELVDFLVEFIQEFSLKKVFIVVDIKEMSKELHNAFSLVKSLNGIQVKAKVAVANQTFEFDDNFRGVLETTNVGIVLLSNTMLMHRVIEKVQEWCKSISIAHLSFTAWSEGSLKVFFSLDRKMA